MFDKRLLNITIVGFGFLLGFTAFQTMSNIEEIFLDSVKKDDKNYTGDGYTSLAIIYIGMAIGNWLAPSVIGTTGAKLGITIGSLSNVVFVASFFIAKTWVLYASSFFTGLTVPLMWTGQGNYLALNSEKNTVTRNTGVFWALYQFSMIFGNVYVFVAFEGKTEIDLATRNKLLVVLTIIAAISVGVFFIMRPSYTSNGEAIEKKIVGPIKSFIESLTLLKKKEMLLLCFTFFYAGSIASFFSGVYGPCIANTLALGKDSKRYMGMSGIVVGIGEILGGTIFGVLGAKTIKWGRNPIIILGCILHLIAFTGIFLNIPNDAPLKETNDLAFIKSNVIIAMVCSFLLGFGDSCFNTQIFSSLSTIFYDHSSEGFAIFSFVTSVASSIIFFSSSYLGLYTQLGILSASTIIGTITYCITEKIATTKDLNKLSEIVEYFCFGL